ncbi:MAG: redoxin domain-containing protein [Caldithrix sp.]|nr:redoxin domain-containing protein [Caldithrix sp.]
MKAIIFFLTLFVSFTLAQELPKAGQEYTIAYDPAKNNILNGSRNLYVIYAFDYWSTEESYAGGARALFDNVLHPDPDRVHKKKLKQDGRFYSARIAIPDTVSLLSYYFTNGTNMDDNNEKTYVSYIYNKNGQPVRGARFRNVDFMVMAGKSKAEQMEEIKRELDAYPDNFMVYIPYWRMRFNQAENLDELMELRKTFEEQFKTLYDRYGKSNDLMLAEVSVYYNISPLLRKLFHSAPPESRGTIRKMSPKITQLMINKIECIPENKRSIWIQQFYEIATHQRTCPTPKPERHTLMQKPAPDFSFTTLQGDTLKLSDFRGKLVLLDFWGLWCKPCVDQIPNLKNVYDHYNDDGLVIISISSDRIVRKKSTDAYLVFIEDKGLDWLQVLDDKKGRIHDIYKVNRWPTLYLIDREGKFAARSDQLRGKRLERTISKHM